MTDRLDEISPNAKDLAHTAQARAKEVGQRALDSTRDGLERAGTCVKDSTSKTLSYVRENPGKAIGIAALVGGAVALCLKGQKQYKARKSHQVSATEKAALVAVALPILQKLAPHLHLGSKEHSKSHGHKDRSNKD